LRKNTRESHSTALEEPLLFTCALANGVDMSTTVKIMGHTDIRMIAEIYNQPQFDTLFTAMQKYET